MASLPACDVDNGGLVLPDGFCAIVVLDSLAGNVRHLTVRDNGDVYVALRRPEDGRGIAALRDTSGDGRFDQVERFGESGGTGIRLHQGYLYFAPDTVVVRYPMTPGDLLPTGPPETIVSGFINQRSHAVKPFEFDEAGGLYVNVGGPSNACQVEARTAGSPCGARSSAIRCS